MRYMGSKGRHAKFLIPHLMKDHPIESVYVEPFCGGGNLLSKVPAKHKHGNDTSRYAVALLKALSEGYIPPENVSEQDYKSAKSNPDNYEDCYIGFLAYSCSYAGKFWSWTKEQAKVSRVFVSEYTAPDWCVCVWEKQVTSSLTKETGAKTSVERLFKC